ncbi:ATP-dependent protease HslVU (ClpYQ), peptidase subunit [Variovorax sp. PBS-H4]|uniref:STAS domain-containing protein n=1 Tax=Variovorax sp. PBS-H4 TaxID=434008 RepID=UPI001318A624|nr:STAS domain-containing protein [Variovorax sp. PBS-H4]VTU22146.1 ATP-dependent protease HslVU (ClpYQ), peptidase subunit [Variovorax sp. PBS-H4]
MAKEDTGRLLSKVAKFVRNPLKDWSELDAEESSQLENGYSREMLKEMIERRQRNDFVRRREFDMLRKLRQREAAGGRDPGATPSSFNISSTTGKTEGRALTLKKIAEIEEQMSQQWWKNRGPGGEQGSGEGKASGDMAAQHARAYADTVPGVSQPQGAAGSSAVPSVSDGCIEEAAIRFAHGDDAGTEAILLQALAPEASGADHDDTWRALFDFYRAVGDAEKFSAAAARYMQRTRRNAPEWISLRAVGRHAQVAAASAITAPPPAPAGGADWASPAVLRREDLLGLTRALGAAGPTWKLDWSALDAIEPDAAGPLRALFNHWADSAVQLRFAGADRLQIVLTGATPVNERRVDAIWWQLHMAALRVMHRPDEFELLALNYCITYEVSPPPWEDPKGDFGELEVSSIAERTSMPSPATPSVSSGFSISGHDDELIGADAVPTHAAAGHGSLVGEIAGESLSTWERLDQELAGAQGLSISCSGLVRLDFVAAGSLLNWVTARDARGERVAFVDAHRLIAAFFGVIGIADHAEVAIRAN